MSAWITLRGNQGRLRMPAEGAPAEGYPGHAAPSLTRASTEVTRDQSREAHHPARPLHSPEELCARKRF